MSLNQSSPWVCQYFMPCNANNYGNIMYISLSKISPAKIPPLPNLRCKWSDLHRLQIYVLHGWSSGQKNEQQNNAPSPKKQCSCRLSGSSKNRAFERCGSTDTNVLPMQALMKTMDCYSYLLSAASLIFQVVLSSSRCPSQTNLTCKISCFIKAHSSPSKKAFPKNRSLGLYSDFTIC